MKKQLPKLQLASFAALGSFTLTALAQEDVISTNEQRVELAEFAAEADVPETTEIFLPDVDGTKIYAGKKTSVAVMENMPPVVDQDIAQAFITIPGVVVSETANRGITNLTYRGLGDPHESQDILTMKNGIPIVSDWFGYSTVYYTPPIESVEKIEFVRGGGALLYGPQIGPVVNYVTPVPRSDVEFSNTTQIVGGSYGYYSFFTRFTGTRDNLGYLADFSAQGGNTKRNNADFTVLTGDLTLTHPISKESQLRFDFTGFSNESGEAGRLTQAQYDADPYQTVRPINRLWVQRYFPVITYNQALADDGLLEIKTWGGYQDRFSRRATGGGAPVTTTIADTNLDRREFYFYGLDARASKDWDGWDTDGNTLTAGFTFYYADAPRTRERGAGTATTGTNVFKVANETLYGAIFAENIFRMGDWALIPSFRLDVPSITSNEEYNTAVTRGLYDENVTSVVPMGGLGITYDYTESNQAYFNASTSYSPKNYGDLGNPTSNTPRVTNNEVAYNFQFELGSRGNPTSYFSYDASAFFMRLTDIVESQTLANGDVRRANAGNADYIGVEGGVSFGAMSFLDAQNGTDYANQYGELDLFANVTVLKAEFTEGRFNGNIPQYAPAMLWKWGAVWNYEDRYKVALTGLYSSSQYWQDSNAGGAANATIPAYMVWDFNVDLNVYENISVVGGINNLFNKNYYSRVRTDGIEPLDPRTFWVGARVEF